MAHSGGRRSFACQAHQTAAILCPGYFVRKGVLLCGANRMMSARRCREVMQAMATHPKRWALLLLALATLVISLVACQAPGADSTTSNNPGAIIISTPCGRLGVRNSSLPAIHHRGMALGYDAECQRYDHDLRDLPDARSDDDHAQQACHRLESARERARPDQPVLHEDDRCGRHRNRAGEVQNLASRHANHGRSLDYLEGRILRPQDLLHASA